MATSFVRKSTKNEGGYISSLPEEGFVLVFEQDTKYCQVFIDGKQLRFESKKGPLWLEKRENETNDILDNLRRANIYYTLRASRDGNYVYVIISISSDKSENWADDNNIDVMLDAQKAILVGRKNEKFALAHNTMLPDDEESYVKWKDHGEFRKLPFESWASIHIPFERVIGDVYLRHPPEDRIIHHRLHLRIIYDILTGDPENGGAGCLVDKYCDDNKHPLKCYFALHSDLYNPTISKSDYLVDKSCYGAWHDRVDNLRDYYGEAIAFYFAFLLHYSKWLISLAIIGTLWFGIQVYFSDIMIMYHNKLVAIIIICLVCLGIIWSTMMLETWYRKENELIFEWGMMRYDEIVTPLPTFQGEFKISTSTGEFIETYHSKFCYHFKRLFALSTMIFCVAIVISCVVGIWIWKKSIEGNKYNTYIGIGIGVINSIQIQIMNALYTKLALILNDFEGHRLQQEYYNSLIIKRITFIVVNSFNSLFYIAFYDDKYDEYNDSDVARLQALRIQLVTLFITAIVIQNSMELFCPFICSKITEKMEERKQAKKHDHHHHHSLSDDDLGSPLGVSLQATYDPLDHGHRMLSGDNSDENDDLDYDTAVTSRSEDEIFDDIESQMCLMECPDILDNTAEIVVLHGYIILFIVILPLMPLLGVLNNIFELRIDYYNFTHCQRPVPIASNGIGVWKMVLSVFNIVAIFSNMGLIVFRTELVLRAVDGVDHDYEWQLIVFFTCTMILLFIQFSIKFIIPDTSQALQDAVMRQKICEKHLLLNKIKIVARRMAKEKKRFLSLTNVHDVNDFKLEENDI